jgi:hypothetical protein
MGRTNFITFLLVVLSASAACGLLAPFDKVADE